MGQRKRNFTQCITVALFLKDKMDKENRLLKQK